MEFRVIPEGDVHARRLLGSDDTLRLLSDLWVEEHVFIHLDQRIRSFFGAHKLFSAMESGRVRVYGAFDQRDVFLGCVFGAIEADGETFNTHCAFRRGADAVAAFEKILPVMVADYRADHVEVRQVAGYIPECNRAAIRAAKRFGCVDQGVVPGRVFIDGEYLLPCRKLVKKIDEVRTWEKLDPCSV